MSLLLSKYHLQSFFPLQLWGNTNVHFEALFWIMSIKANWFCDSCISTYLISEDLSSAQTPAIIPRSLNPAVSYQLFYFFHQSEGFKSRSYKKKGINIRQEAYILQCILCSMEHCIMLITVHLINRCTLRTIYSYINMPFGRHNQLH